MIKDIYTFVTQFSQRISVCIVKNMQVILYGFKYRQSINLASKTPKKNILFSIFICISNDILILYSISFFNKKKC